MSNEQVSVEAYFLGPGRTFGVVELARFASPASPTAMTVADLDGDGRSDILVCSGYAYWLRGLGENRFEAPVNTVGGSCDRLLVLDFNLDGLNDIVSATFGDRGTVQVALADGHGGFTGLTMPKVSNIQDFTVVDFDRNGFWDIAYVSLDPNRVGAILQFADEEFLEVQVEMQMSRPTTLAVADFQGDGWLDIAVTNEWTSFVAVLFGDGQGGLLEPGFYPVGPILQFVRAFSNPMGGLPDLLVCSRYWTTLMKNRGNGTYNTPLAYGAGRDPRAVVTEDFDGDGELDVAVASQEDSTLAILRNLGAGNFGQAQTLETAPRPSHIVVTDLNGDGSLDLAVAGLDGVVAVHLNSQDGTFSDMSFYPCQTYVSEMIAADLNGDGAPDLIAVHYYSNLLTILENDGTGRFLAAREIAVPPSPVDVVAVDVNSDGGPDLVVEFMGASELKVYRNHKDGSFEEPYSIEAGIGTEIMTAGDFNGDGMMDIVVSEGTAVSVLLGDGAGGFSRREFGFTGWRISNIILEDVDGDDWQDLVVTDQMMNAIVVRKNLLGTGLSDNQFFATGERPTGIAVGDWGGPQNQDKK